MVRHINNRSLMQHIMLLLFVSPFPGIVTCPTGIVCQLFTSGGTMHHSPVIINSNTTESQTYYSIIGKQTRSCRSGCCSKPWHEWLDAVARIVYPALFIVFATFYWIHMGRKIKEEYGRMGIL